MLTKKNRYIQPEFQPALRIAFSVEKIVAEGRLDPWTHLAVLYFHFPRTAPSPFKDSWLASKTGRSTITNPGFGVAGVMKRVTADIVPTLVVGWYLVPQTVAQASGTWSVHPTSPGLVPETKRGHFAESVVGTR